MALDLVNNATFNGRITGASAGYPHGSSKNESTPGANDGTPYNLQRADDIFGFQQAMLAMAGITPSGAADSVTESQYLQALIQLATGRAGFYDESGAADAYVLDVKTDQPSPAALFDGSIAYFTPGNTNTGASTANLAGLGAANIKLKGGVVDPGADDLRAGREEKITYRLLPSPHFELSRAGRFSVEYLTVSDPSFEFAPDTTKAVVQAVGAGGAGGGTVGAVGAAATSAGGAGGGTAHKIIELPTGTYAVVVGSGGVKATGAGGGAGTATTFTGAGATLVGNGGAGGGAGIATAGLGRALGRNGGTATGGDVNEQGGASMDAVFDYNVFNATSTGSQVSRSIPGGSSQGPSLVEGNSLTRGAGGGGTRSYNEGLNRAGSDGEPGVVVVTQYYA